MLFESITLLDYYSKCVEQARFVMYQYLLVVKHVSIILYTCTYVTYNYIVYIYYVYLVSSTSHGKNNH